MTLSAKLSAQVAASNRAGRLFYHHAGYGKSGQLYFRCADITVKAFYAGKVDGWESFRVEGLDSLVYARIIPITSSYINCYQEETIEA